MAFVSDRRLPKLSVGLDLKAIDLQRIKRLAVIGAPRRVPLVPEDDRGGDIKSSYDSSREFSEQRETISSLEGSVGRVCVKTPKSRLASVENFELGKRKAERDLGCSRDRTRSAEMDGQPNPNTKAPLVLGSDLKKNIESVKELFAIQDKENVDPGGGCRRRETRKQAYERCSAEKRRLQVSNKHLNAPGQSKFRSLLLKQHSPPGGELWMATPPEDGHQPSFLILEKASSEMCSDCPADGLLQQVDRVDFPVSSKETESTSTGQTSRSLSAASPVFQQTTNAVSNTCDSISISQHVQLAAAEYSQSNKLSEEQLSEVGLGMLASLKQRVSVNSLEMADAQASTIIVESSQTKVVSASVRELSCSMISLAISDSSSHEDSHLPSAPVSEKADLKEGSLHAQNYVLEPSGLCAQQDGQNINGPEVDVSGLALSMSGPADGLYKKKAFAYANVASRSSPNRMSPKRQVEDLRQTMYSHTCSDDVPPAACSMPGKTASTPSASCASRSQQLTEQNSQPPCTLISSRPAETFLKSSQDDRVCIISPKKQAHPFPGEGLSPFKATMVESGMVKTRCDRKSQGEILRAEGVVAKSARLPQIKDGPERKAPNGADVSLQQRRHVETEHFVWVNDIRYQKLKKIGRGGSSEVYKVIDRDCTIYALKRIKLKGRDYATAFGFYQEIEYLNKLHGKAYIIQLIDHEVTDKSIFREEVDRSHIIKDDVYIYMVLEYGEIDLAHMLADKWKEGSQHNKELDETWLRFYWKQILEAVNTIHEERIVHSDLKPANFLLVKGVLKLIDFGIAKAIQSDTTNIERESQVGTLNYMSPEAFLMNEKDDHGQVVKCGRPSDIWSLGCILYQMVYGTTPFSHITRIWAKVQEVTNPNHKINFPALSNPHLLDITKRCLAWKRDERIRIPELLNHPFLQPHLAHSPYQSYSKQQKEEIISQIQRDHMQDTEINNMCAKLLERLRFSEPSA